MRSASIAAGRLGPALVLATSLVTPGPHAQDAEPPPHVVVILADDLGYGDVSALNSAATLATPNLDRLAAGGMTFTDAHSPSAVCTPTRYGLLTGRYCWRTRLKSGVLFPPKDRPLLDDGRTTLGSLLQKAGYHTSCIGKWHLGFGWARDDAGKVDFAEPLEHGPTDCGFDRFFGIAASLDMVPYAFYEGRQATASYVGQQPGLKFPRFVRKGPIAEGFDPGAVLDELTRQAESTIATRADGDAPFFLYLPLTAPHKPVWPAERFVGKTDLGPYGDFVTQVDASVGRVLDAIDEAGIADRTLVLFTSDNGSFMYRRDAADAKDHVDDEKVQAFRADRHRANGPWRGTKADIWEGGHRVPFFARWPGRTPPGSTCATPICHVDVFATLAAIVGREIADDEAEDSYSFATLLERPDAEHARPPVVHHSVNGTFAIRDGSWKLVLGNGSGGREKPKGKPFGEPFQLYDLTKDPSESHDVAADHDDVVTRLTATLKRFRSDGRSVTR